VTSRIVLGAATYGRISQTEVNVLLATALESGITKIDTAHGYEGSEERIGVFLGTGNQFEINTKVGLPDPSTFTPKGIKYSVEDSLKRLGIESLNTLFVHSLDSTYLTQENIGAMLELKQQGKIKQIGYAGDNENLEAATNIESFDEFIATFNIIDQSNASVIRSAQQDSDFYFKLVLGQAIWTNLEWKRRVRSNKIMRFIFRKPPVPESWTDYSSRFNTFKGEIVGNDYAATFLRFALFSGSAKQNVILGTHSAQHIRDAVQIEQNQKNFEALNAAKYEELWARKSSSDWRAHIG